MIRTSSFTRAGRKSAGLSLLEVIACTALVSVLMIPIASVMRASTQTMAQTQGGHSTPSDLRTAMRWTGDSLRQGTLVSVATRRLTMQLASGDVVRVFVARRNLVVDDGTNQTIIAEDVRDVQFTLHQQTAPPRKATGVSMTLRATDKHSGELISVSSVIAIPPQA